MAPRGLLLWALACCAWAPAAHAERTAFQVRCEDSIAKTVTVLSAQQNGYSVDTHLSYRALTVMKGVAAQNTFVAGLTRTEAKMAIDVDGPLLQDSVSGYECLAPQIKVKLYYAPVVVYVAHEIPVGGCAYGEVLAHEMRHLKTYMDSLPRVEKTVREALAKRFMDKPLYAPSGTAMSALEHEMSSGWMPFIRAEMAKTEVLQEAIDSPEEYARLSKVCNGELQTILGRTQPRRP